MREKDKDWTRKYVDASVSEINRSFRKLEDRLDTLEKDLRNRHLIGNLFRNGFVSTFPGDWPVDVGDLETRLDALLKHLGLEYRVTAAHREMVPVEEKEDG